MADPRSSQELHLAPALVERHVAAAIADARALLERDDAGAALAILTRVPADGLWRVTHDLDDAAFERLVDGVPPARLAPLYEKAIHPRRKARLLAAIQRGAILERLGPRASPRLVAELVDEVQVTIADLLARPEVRLQDVALAAAGLDAALERAAGPAGEP
jgi:hypothetical protein